MKFDVGFRWLPLPLLLGCQPGSAAPPPPPTPPTPPRPVVVTARASAAPAAPALVETPTAMPSASASASAPPEPAPLWADLPAARFPSPTVKVPAGRFVMGCTSSMPCKDDERPAHSVLVSAFAIDEHEVTVAQYAACMAAGKCHAKLDVVGSSPSEATAEACHGQFVVDRARHPVTCVTHFEAETYCTWRGKRLPTEAEWERAARGTGQHHNPWGNAAPTADQACVDTTGTCEVGTHPQGASPFGAHDMIGNAAEWIWDAYHPTYYGTSPKRDPDGFHGLLPIQLQRCRSSRCRILRGGSWASPPDDQTATRRGLVPDGDWSAKIWRQVGFRCLEGGVKLFRSPLG